MIITDRVYGQVSITSPVLLSLITSKSMQRLKGIGQMGQPEISDPRKYKFSRYDHCIGVMLLLKILGAAEEEQIAGLLHDVSHTAFSHTIDSVLQRGRKQDYQDSQHEQFIKKSEIPLLLKRFSYDAERIANYKHFTLLEQPLPALCADRVDYALRESPSSIAKRCLPHLIAKNGRMVFDDIHAARIFADRFLYLQHTSWAGKGPVIREQLFAQVLQYALAEKIITLEDFWEDDALMMDKLTKSQARYINKVLTAMKLKSFGSQTKNYTVVKRKFRFVDPGVVVNEKIVKLSSFDPVFRQKLIDAKVRNEAGIRVPLIK